jgi:hypothetical protein
MKLIEKIEAFIGQYLSFEQPGVPLAIALWMVATHMFERFDAFAYVVITSKTKRSGKTRLSEVISFACSNPMNFSTMSSSNLFRVVNPDPEAYYTEKQPFVPPTVMFDEAESLNSEAAGTMRSVLNAGYRKGQVVPRTVGQRVVQFKIYCPKVFILIGDVFDTLRDRSIIINMVRGESKRRFLYDEAQQEGAALRSEITAWMYQTGTRELTPAAAATVDHFKTDRAEYLSDRDEEIWAPIFAVCKALCPERYRELQRLAVDLCAAKTAEKTAYKTLDLFESKTEQTEYAEKAAVDLLAVINGDKAIGSADAVQKLRDLDLAPWRTYRGRGLDQHLLGDLLASIGIPSVNVRMPGGRANGKVLKGYRRLDVETVVKGFKAK